MVYPRHLVTLVTTTFGWNGRYRQGQRQTKQDSRNKRGQRSGGPNCGTHHLVTIKLECRSAWPGYCMEQSWFWQKYQMTSSSTPRFYDQSLARLRVTADALWLEQQWWMLSELWTDRKGGKHLCSFTCPWMEAPPAPTDFPIWFVLPRYALCQLLYSIFTWQRVQNKSKVV